ncbi:MAG: DUF4395 domain-containing protein [Flammeovirgaceae bacterium]
MNEKSVSHRFGEIVEGYSIPVLNEREIRAAAGILFLAVFLSLMFILFKGNFVPVKYVITLFFADFLIRVFASPRYSPTLILGRLIVNNQTPEYVGAHQKKFAWTVGLILSATMFALMVLVNSYSPITGIVCLLCLIFLFFESAFGICLACKFYGIVFKTKVQYCPGEVCDARARHKIQKTSRIQWLILVVFISFIFTLSALFHPEFEKKPVDLFGINTAQAN